MSGNLLMLAIELQLCLLAAATLANPNNARKAAAVQRDGFAPAAKARRRLEAPAPIGCGLFEPNPRARRSTVPERRARLAP